MEYKDATAEDLLLVPSFINYINRSNPDDVNFWENWISANPEKQPVIQQAVTLHRQLGYFFVVHEDNGSNVSRFKESFRHHTMRRKRLPGHLFYYSGIAASLLLALSFWLFQSRNKAQAPAPEQTYVSKPVSDKQHHTLPDGSRVILNPNSTIRLAEDYNDSDRVVYLEGQAFFEVKKDAARPFIVRSGKIATTALGTSFMVRYFPKEEKIRVSLVTGKVKVEAAVAKGPANSMLVLSPGEEVRVGSKQQDHHLKKTIFPTADVAEWKNDHLLFRDAAFTEVTKKLEEWYGVRITLNNRPLRTKHFTGEFRGKRLSEVLDALSFSNDFNYTMGGDRVAITFR
ncbi:MAG TPA: FecR domain-containing protein [Sphingobacteriaceae bacterium]